MRWCILILVRRNKKKWGGEDEDGKNGKRNCQTGEIDAYSSEQGRKFSGDFPVTFNKKQIGGLRDEND